MVGVALSEVVAPLVESSVYQYTHILVCIIYNTHVRIYNPLVNSIMMLHYCRVGT